MAGFRNRTGRIVNGGGSGFVPGHWKADAPIGTVAIPEGPQAPMDRPEDAPTAPGGRKRDPRTAANLHAREDALTSRRWRPGQPLTETR